MSTVTREYSSSRNYLQTHIRFLKVLFCAFVLIFIVSSGQAATDYYVSYSAGDDTANGSINQPWKTLRRALTGKTAKTQAIPFTYAQPGDTVYLRGGAHQQTDTIPSHMYESWAETITQWTHGLNVKLTDIDPDQKWVTIKPYPREKPYFPHLGYYSTITGTDTNQASLLIGRTSRDSYTPWQFEGIEFRGTVHLIRCIGVRFINCTFQGDRSFSYDDPVYPDCPTKATGWGLYLGTTAGSLCSDIVVDGCTFNYFNRCVISLCNYFTLKNSELSHSRDDLLNLKGGSDILIENNEIHDLQEPPFDNPPHGDLVQLNNSPDNGPMERIAIRGNIIHDGWSQGLWLNSGSTIGRYSDLLVENNLIYDCAKPTGNSLSVTIHSIEKGFVFRHNTVIGKSGFGYPSNNMEIYNNIFCSYEGQSTCYFINNAVTNYNYSTFVSTYPNALKYHDYNIYLNANSAGEIGDHESNSYEFTSGRAAMTANLFQDAENDNYNLRPGSIAIDFGVSSYSPDNNVTSLNTPANDILGYNRNVGAPDAGCYEHGAGPVQSNQSPVLTAIGNKIVDAAATLTFTVYAADPDGDSLTYAFLPVLTGASLDPQTGVFTWTPDKSQVGRHSVTFTVSDGSDADSETIDITVNAIVQTSAIVTMSSENTVDLLLDDTVTSATVENVNNYYIHKAGYSENAINVQNASLDYGLNRVRLTTAPHTKNMTYILTAPYLQADLIYTFADGIVGFWKFDDGAGVSAKDSSGMANTAAVDGPAWADNSLTFDGVDDNVQVPTTDCDAAKGTVALWANASDFSGTRYFFGHTIGSWSNRIQLYAKEGNLCLGLGDSHSVRLNIQQLDTQKWYHIGLTWDGTNYAVYIDGIVKATGSYTGLTSLNTVADIGNTGNTSWRVGEVFNGDIDDVRVYKRALNADEIMELYNTQIFMFEPIGNRTVNENETLTIPLILTDPDNPDTPVSAVPMPWGAEFSDHIFTWTPDYDQAGIYDVNFIAWNDEIEDVETITITVNNVNRSPVLNPIDNRTIYENDVVMFTVDAVDPDNGDEIAYFASNLPAGAVFSNQVFGWSPTYDQAGDYMLSFTATDGELEDIESVIITVNNTNLPPVIEPVGNKTVYENQSLIFTVNATDSDGDSISYSATGLPAGAVFNGNTFTWTPTYDQAGSYDIEITATDGSLQDIEVVTIVVLDSTPPNSEIIIDNGDDDATAYTGKWKVSGGADPYGVDSFWSRNGATYTWIFTPTEPGFYDVSMCWTAWSSRSNNIPVSISYSGGTATVYINQKLNTSRWNSLGSYYFQAGRSYHITITSAPKPASTCADAVKFTRK